MILTQTPFRVSFFGGGTDYGAWVEAHGGAVLSTAINRHCYLSCRRLPPFFPHRYRIAYSQIETVTDIVDIQHPAVRAVLEYMGFHEDALEIHYDADLPARCGLGTSSSFTVGLLQALLAFRGRSMPKKELAQLAIHLEQKVMCETVGSQDQTAAVYGGFNRIDFHRDHSISVTPVIAPPGRVQLLQDHLMLFFTGFSRIASEIAKAQVASLKEKESVLHAMRKMVDEAWDILQNEKLDIRAFGELLHTAWLQKKSIASNVSTDAIDRIYERARAAGAVGGKLLGAGGGGFMLLFAEPSKQQAVKEALSDLLHVPFAFEPDGSRVVIYQPNGF